MNLVRRGGFVAGLLSAALVACGGSPKPVAAPAPPRATSAEVTDDSSAGATPKSAAEAWAEKKVAAEAKDAKAKKSREELDPLAMNSDVEAAAIPKIEMTPAKELHPRSRRDFDAAVAVVGSASSVDGAAKKLVSRLGKPTWTENGQRRIWVAAAPGGKCHRLVLEADGSAEVDIASKSEWRGLSALAQQNPCTGEIKRGISGPTGK